MRKVDTKDIYYHNKYLRWEQDFQRIRMQIRRRDTYIAIFRGAILKVFSGKLTQEVAKDLVQICEKAVVDFGKQGERSFIIKATEPYNMCYDCWLSDQGAIAFCTGEFAKAL